jgi:hypothetical protein
VQGSGSSLDRGAAAAEEWHSCVPLKLGREDWVVRVGPAEGFYYLFTVFFMLM